MDAQSKDFQGNGSQDWSTRHRPICIESEPPDTGVRIMVTRANAVATDAFNLTWNYQLSYLFPPFSLILLCLKKIERSSRMHFHCTSLEKQTVVCNSSVNVVQISSSTPRNEQDSHLLYPKVFQTSCMESFRQRLHGQGFPQEVSNILLSS